MAVAIKPLEDRIVVKTNEAETTTASGLVIPDTAKEKSLQLAQGALMMEFAFQWMSRLAMSFSTASTVEPK
jgi:hypothetical protein